MKFLPIAALCLVSAVPAQAAPNLWMKRSNPETLGYVAVMSKDCEPFDLDQVVRGIMIAARMKPVTPDHTPDLWIDVLVDCIDNHENLRPVSIDVTFETLKDGDFVSYTAVNYGNFGTMRREDVQQSVYGAVEKAIRDYLEAQTKF
jgi:hypothetical protein